MHSNRQRIYQVVRQIPIGYVSTYGDVARLAGLAGHARQVGYALFNLPAEAADVPWHRVINAKGSISARSHSDNELQQRYLLEAEGIAFNQRDKVDLKQYRWLPPELLALLY